MTCRHPTISTSFSLLYPHKLKHVCSATQRSMLPLSWAAGHQSTATLRDEVAQSSLENSSVPVCKAHSDTDLKYHVTVPAAHFFCRPSFRNIGRSARPRCAHQQSVLVWLRWLKLNSCNQDWCLRKSIVSQGLQSLNYPMKLQKLLLTPQREVLVELCITKDNGEIETFNAYRQLYFPMAWPSCHIFQALIRRFLANDHCPSLQ